MDRLARKLKALDAVTGMFDRAKDEQVDAYFSQTARSPWAITGQLDPRCTHCYHDTGVVLTSNPPQYPQVCCHCGGQGPNRTEKPPQIPPGHGKFYPTGGW